ncbi:hypothetical protein CUMW_096940 [Citrus unshiu]|uniref:Uncharacterized protein n=1 Tax=Citrus unshiu TaxID=55188 RepID=A0A2H5P218_CITUN|nr:hypothetical protein CUMW_096940 [Citrus unshiu]
MHNKILLHYVATRRFLGGNIIRRKLLRHEKHNGPRVATNLIVWCWRCQNDWANNRHKLADCTLSFGKHATGGKHGPIYMVTDSSDNQCDHKNLKLGTLRLVVTQKGPLWIIFERNISIKLRATLGIGELGNRLRSYMLEIPHCGHQVLIC